MAYIIEVMGEPPVRLRAWVILSFSYISIYCSLINAAGRGLARSSVQLILQSFTALSKMAAGDSGRAMIKGTVSHAAHSGVELLVDFVRP